VPSAATAAVKSPLVVHEETVSGRCEAYVANHPLATAYHHPSWLKLIASAFGQETRYLTAESAQGIVGVLPLVLFSGRLSSRIFGRFAVSMPFVNYGGVLADTPEAERALLERAIDVTRASGGTHLELRHTYQKFSDLAPRRHKVAMRLGLETTSDEQWQRLDRKVRNQVRKAEKSGLDVQHGGQGLLPLFYGVFARHMRDLGTPVYGSRFFDDVLSTFPDTTRVFVVTLAGRALAAAVVHWHRDTVEVPWASALRESNPLCANVFLYWHMLTFAVERGFRQFDFGRSTPGEGTFNFKKQWGAEPQPLVWEYWMAGGGSVPDLSPKNPKYALAIKAWQHLPVGVATALGPHIVRNIP